LLAEPPLSGTLQPNLRCDSPRFPFSDGLAFRDGQIQNEPWGGEAACPCPSTCASPTCTGDAVAPLPRCLGLCQGSPRAVGLGLAALGRPPLCRSAYVGSNSTGRPLRKQRIGCMCEAGKSSVSSSGGVTVNTERS